MSDASQGPGWWQASDGRWYPPELHPDAARRLPPPTASSRPTLPGPDPARVLPSQPHVGPIVPKGQPWWRRWWVIALAVLVIIGGAVAVANRGDDEESQPPADAEPDPGAEPAPTVTVPSSAGTAASEEADDQEDGDATTDDPPETEPTEATEPEIDEPEPPPVGTRDLPFAIGAPARFTLDTFGDADGSTWTLTVDGPGTDITRAVLEENPFNDPPEDGKVFYGVPVTLTLNGAGKEPLSSWLNISLEFFGPASLEIVSPGLDDSCGVTPDEFNGFKEVFVGGSISGTICYAVTTEDVEAGVMLTLDEIDGGRIFLATVDGAGATPPPDDTAPDETTAPLDDGSIGSRSNPFLIGDPAEFTLDTFGDVDGSTWTLTVGGPGADITQAVLDENPFNDPPEDGKVFYGVPVTLKLTGAGKEPLSPFINISLEFFGPASLEIVSPGFDESCGVTPGEFDLFREVFVGGSISGTVCYAVTAEDVDAGVMVTVDGIEAGRIFLATRE